MDIDVIFEEGKRSRVVREINDRLYTIKCHCNELPKNGFLRADACMEAMWELFNEIDELRKHL